MSFYMFRALNARLCLQSDSTICCIYKVCPPEDEYLRLETFRRT